MIRRSLIAAIAFTLGAATLSVPHLALAQAAGTTRTPTVSSCGTGPTIVADGYIDLQHTELWGEITTGTGSPTSCTVTFPAPFPHVTYCVLHDRTTQANLVSDTLTTSAIVITTTASSSQKIDYICIGS